MRKNIIYYLAIALLLTSCGKEISIETNGNVPGNGNGNGSGNGNGNGTQTGTGNFQPNAKDSWWKYKQTGSFAGETTLTSKGEKRTVNGIPCTVFTSVSTTAPTPQEGFFGVKGHELFTIVKGVSPNTGASFDLSFLYLNDTASVGYKWTNNAGTGNGFTAYTPGTILEKGITVTVEGKTYKDVTHTQMELQYEFPVLGIISLGTYDYYVAKDIGIIRIISKAIDMTGVTVAESDMTLLEYSIK